MLKKDRTTPIPLVNLLSCDDDGRRKIRGNADLKSSQVYPAAFGQAIQRVWRQHSASMRGSFLANFKKFDAYDVTAIDLFGVLRRGNKWADAKLAPVFGVLRD